MVEDGSEEQLGDAEDVQCRDGDLDYVDEEGEVAEEEEVEEEEGIEEEKKGVEEREAGELDDEDNPQRSESSDVSCRDLDSEETNSVQLNTR